MLASTTSATAAAGAFAVATKPRGSAVEGRRRRPAEFRRGAVRCDAGVEAQAQAASKAAGIAALEQFKISADRELLASLT